MTAGIIAVTSNSLNVGIFSVTGIIVVLSLVVAFVLRDIADFTSLRFRLFNEHLGIIIIPLLSIFGLMIIERILDITA